MQKVRVTGRDTRQVGGGLMCLPGCRRWLELTCLPRAILLAEAKILEPGLQDRGDPAFFSCALLLLERWLKLSGEGSVGHGMGLFCHVGGWFLGGVLSRHA